MRQLLAVLMTRVASLRDRLLIDLNIGISQALLIDRGRGMLYDVERDITWLQDANYARTVGRSPDGQLTWHDAKAWVATLSYRGIRGWRLPDARSANGSGPTQGENNADGEIGHLFIVASQRKVPSNLEVTNFQGNSIYWYRNEASDTDAYAFRLTFFRQAHLGKDPWAGEFPVPLIDKVLAWPVHDGDVGRRLFSRFAGALISTVLRRSG